MTNLRRIRIKNGLTKAELAERSGVSVNMIVKYENGQRNIDGAGLDILTKLAMALNVKIADILENKKLIKNVEKCI